MLQKKLSNSEKIDLFKKQNNYSKKNKQLQRANYLEEKYGSY